MGGHRCDCQERVSDIFLLSVMESLIFYNEGMGITNLLQELTIPSPNGEENIDMDLVRNTTLLIQNPRWGSNLHWISAANK